MPRPDPIPSPRHSTRRRFKRIVKLLALLSIVVGALAVFLVGRGDPTLHIHMLIATFLGVTLTMLLGTSLMTLAFLSSSSGHDHDAAKSSSLEKDKE